MLLDDWKTEGRIPEVDWSTRIRSLDFQEMVRSRAALLKRISTYKCVDCPDFEHHVSIIYYESSGMLNNTSQYRILHGEKRLRANIESLKMAISEQNLELIPDYEQRIDVLKELKFIDENSTVLLKGRVACEVCYSIPRTCVVQPLTIEPPRSTPPTNSFSPSSY